MKTNNTPFMDVCVLLLDEIVKNADGYVDDVVTTESEVFCSIADGCSRAEFYEAAKAGFKITAQAEIYEDDYAKQTRLRFNEDEFKIVRVFPSGHGTLFLSLEEVVR